MQCERNLNHWVESSTLSKRVMSNRERWGLFSQRWYGHPCKMCTIGQKVFVKPCNDAINVASGTLTPLIIQDMARDRETGSSHKSEGELEQCVILVFTNISSLGIRDCYYICVLLSWVPWLCWINNKIIKNSGDLKHEGEQKECGK